MLSTMKKKILSKSAGFRHDRKGLSLVELIIAILIMSVFMTAVVSLISSSRVVYTEVNSDAVVQTETETVRSFISEIAIEAKECGQRSFTAPATEEGEEAENCSCIWFLAPNNETSDGSYCYYCILLEGNTNILRYKKVSASDSSLTDADGKKFGVSTFDYNTFFTGTKGNEYCLLAQHANAITCSTIGVGDSGSKVISVNLTFHFNNADYTRNMRFAARNMS